MYTQSKLYRFGMSDMDRCPRCDGIEDLKHKFIGCPYVERIWQSARIYLNKLQDLNDPNEDKNKIAIGASRGTNRASMTYTAELLQFIHYLKREQTFLLHPKTVTLRALKNLVIKEGHIKTKERFIALLNETNRD